MWFPPEIWHIILYDFAGIHKYYLFPARRMNRVHDDYYKHMHTKCFDKVMSHFTATPPPPHNCVIILNVLRDMIKWNEWVQAVKVRYNLWDTVAYIVARRCEHTIHQLEEACDCHDCEVCTMTGLLFSTSRTFFKVYLNDAQSV